MEHKGDRCETNQMCANMTRVKFDIPIKTTMSLFQNKFDRSFHFPNTELCFVQYVLIVSTNLEFSPIDHTSMYSLLHILLNHWLKKSHNSHKFCAVLGSRMRSSFAFFLNCCILSSFSTFRSFLTANKNNTKKQHYFYLHCFFLAALTFVTHWLPKACRTEEGMEFQSSDIML